MCGAGAGATIQTTLASLQGAVARREMAVAAVVCNFSARASLLRTASRAAPRTQSSIPGLAQAVLAGYMQGLRNVFRLCIPAAGLSLFAAFFLIAHQDLTREDDEVRKLQARVWLESRKEKHAKNMEDKNVSREQGMGIEMVPVAK
ncbi:hypothetical protein B0H21DRAFT_824885 [Amylocystis lapponica]|nr:hypothetical protein B0H21DRAFT_824885 [Amylocystis lapponica]